MGKTLFIRFSSLGDTILTTGVIRAAEGERHILTYTEFADVWRGLAPAGNIHTIPRGMPLAEYIKFLHSMPQFDEIYDLHANTRSLIARWFIKGHTHVYKKQSLARRLYVKFRWCRSSLTKHTVERYAEAVWGAQIPTLEELRPYLEEGKAAIPNKIVIHPFASKKSKEWHGFPELAARLADMGYNVVVVGKGEFLAPLSRPSDTLLQRGRGGYSPPPLGEGGAQRRERGSSNITRTAPSTLPALFDLMADAALVISTDSGPMHAAVALNRRLLAIFCSTTRELGFYPKFTNCEIIERANLACRPCHVHGQNVCPRGDWACMAISVDEVLEAACRMIEK